MVEKGNKSVSELFIEKTDLACEKEFSHLLEPDSAAKYGDAYAKYVDNALVRLEGMVVYAECLMEGHAALMTVVNILSRWRNRLHAVRDCKENMRVFARSEREIVTLFREFCRACVDTAARLSEENPDTKPAGKEYVRHRKEAVLSFLGEIFPMPELYEISDLYPIPPAEDGSETNPWDVTKQPEKTVKLTIELTEKELRACETMMVAEKKIRAALAEAGRET